jgi:hypothetical protein
MQGFAASTRRSRSPSESGLKYSFQDEKVSPPQVLVREYFVQFTKSLKAEKIADLFSRRGKLLRHVYAAFNCALIVLQVLAVLCALAQPAYAYADPGAGLLALQLISTTFAGIIFMIRKRLRRIFRIKSSAPKSEEDAQK